MPRKHKRGERQTARKTMCPRCGKSAGSQAPPTVTSTTRVMWDGTHVSEAECSRCGWRSRDRKWVPRSIHERDVTKGKEPGYHLSGKRGGAPEGEEVGR
jgi:Zn ribbon nucleic-acid-binding protein